MGKLVIGLTVATIGLVVYYFKSGLNKPSVAVQGTFRKPAWLSLAQKRRSTWARHY